MPDKMSNKEIAKAFSELAKLMELHNENPFKIKSYSNAYLNLRKLPESLADMTVEEIDNVPGIGAAISGKIQELLLNGKMNTLEKYREMTPEGVREMLEVNGLGPKKVEAIWKKLDITSVGELLYACNENRLVELSGFGAKTQAEVKARIEFYYNATGKLLYANAIKMIMLILDKLKKLDPDGIFELAGDLRRTMPIIEKMEILFVNIQNPDKLFSTLGEVSTADNSIYDLKTENDVHIYFIHGSSSNFGNDLFLNTGPQTFIEEFKSYKNIDLNKQFLTEEEIFKSVSLPYILPELRDNDYAVNKWLHTGILPELIHLSDINGVLHNHSTWSDGINTLEEMAEQVRANGFKYFGITDHSKSAFYANGLSIDRIYAQMEEIDKLNEKYTDFKIYKGIESDILSDGALDYPDEVLAAFDFIVASVHSNLNMDIDKATKRLVKAIENPYTRILGHPTGRLLLSRKGYPIDHKIVIDACSENKVVIELNSNPYRLDIDWTWIPYAMEKGVSISINPDAHNKNGIFDIEYGVLAARKGGLTKEFCLNSRSPVDFETWILDRS